jgi:DNA-binding SARP family transcriptional activator
MEENMGNLAISLLGSMRVILDGALVSAFESDKVRALLAYLAVEGGQPARRETLAELLWPEHSERRARRDLSQALYNLRQTLQERLSEAPPLFLLTPETIQLNPTSDFWLDVDEFTHLIETCDRHPHHLLEACPACQERFQQAVSLYQGDFLQGFSLRDSAAYEEWILVCRERYRLLARRALASLATFHERQGHTQDALGAARRLAELDPFDDGACQQVMRLLVACGSRSEALAYYENFRCTLRTELGLEPHLETIALYERIHRRKDGEPAPAPRRHNLPASLSPLIGREAELAGLQRRLLDPACRLLTVLGPGGSGKSRLALEAARGLLERFADGVYLVYLSPLTSPEAILPSVAEAVGLQIQPQKPLRAQVQDYLRQKELLLLLDGCEGLLEGVPLVLEMLRAATDLKVLATSRVRLNAEEEQVYLLGGLECPSLHDLESAANAAAVRLFSSGARRAHPGFELDPRSLPALAEICAEVEGMPLAILLAAAWVELFTPVEILAEMRKSLDFLQAEWASLPPRQRSVRATFDYSWKLLDEGEQAIFRALCVFRGLFTRQAAEAVSGANAQELRRLVDRSLVMPLMGEWYAVHTLLRQYGLEKLDRQPTASQGVHRRYSAYYLGKLVEWEAGLKGAQRLATLSSLDVKINDLRSAWEWAAEQHEIDGLSRALEGLCLYYELRSRFIEGKSLCRETAIRLAHPQDLHARLLLARLAAWESRFCRLLGEPALAQQRLEESQALVDELAASGIEAHEAQALVYLEAGEAVFLADLAAAQRHLEHSLLLYRLLGDAWRTANVLFRLGINRGHAGDYAGSDRLLTEAIELYQKLGASSGIANAQRIIAQNQVRFGKNESALALMRQVIASSQASGDRVKEMLDLRTLALLMVWNGLYEGPSPMLQQALSLARDLGNRYEIAFIHCIFGFYGQMTGQYELARRHHAFTLEVARRDGFQREAAASLFSIGCITLVEKSSQEAWPLLRESLALYRQIGHQDELSWALSLEAFCLLNMGETGQARQGLIEALEIARSIRANLGALLSLSVSALWLGGQGEGAKALEIYELVAQQPIFANSAWFKELFGKSILALTAGLPAEVAASARERGRQRQLWPSVEEVHEILKTNYKIAL